MHQVDYLDLSHNLQHIHTKNFINKFYLILHTSYVSWTFSLPSAYGSQDTLCRPITVLDDRRRTRRSAARSSDHSSPPRRSHPAPNFPHRWWWFSWSCVLSSKAEELWILTIFSLIFFCFPYIPFHYDFTIINLFIFPYIVAIRPFSVSGYAL